MAAVTFTDSGDTLDMNNVGAWTNDAGSVPLGRLPMVGDTVTFLSAEANAGTLNATSAVFHSGVFINGGTFNALVTNHGTIFGGTFNQIVTNDLNGIVAGGVFNADLVNLQSVSASIQNPVINAGLSLDGGTTWLRTSIVHNPANCLCQGIIRDGRGIPEAGVVVSYQLSEPPTAPSGCWDRAKLDVTSDGSGNIAVDLPQGTVYQFFRSNGRRITVVVPNAGTLTLPDIPGPRVF